MATTKAQFEAALKSIDDETTRIGTRFAELLEQVKGGGLTEADEDAAFAEMNRLADNLKKIGADPENPVPGEEETPTDPNA